MGISSSSIAPLLFPAPNPPRYRPSSFPAAMLWLPRLHSKRTTALPCFFVHAARARGLMLYFHGNGCDLGEMSEELVEYSQEFQLDVLGVEWTGYGYSLGSSSEDVLNQDALDAWTFVTSRWGVRPEHIVLFGRSIGTGPAVWLAYQLTASKIPLAGLILQSPYTSINAVVAHMVARPAASLISSIWPNVRRIPSVVCPLLVIHGEKDQLIPSVQGIALFEVAGTPTAHRSLKLCSNADHNVWDLQTDILDPILEFLDHHTNLKLQLEDDLKQEHKMVENLIAHRRFEVDPSLFLVPGDVASYYQQLEAAARLAYEKKQQGGNSVSSFMSASLSAMTSATKSSLAATSALLSPSKNTQEPSS